MIGRSDGQPYSPQTVCCALIPHCPAKTGSEAARPAANRQTATAATTTRASFRTTAPCVPKRAALRRPPCELLTPPVSLLVERRLDLRDLLGLEVAPRLGVAVRLDLAAEVEPEPGESVRAVGPDLLERREELLLGLRARERARRHLVGGTDLDRPVPLQARRRRDQLPD